MSRTLSTTPGTTWCSRPGVKPLGVLANDDEIDVLVGRLHAGQRAHGPHAGVEIESLPQPDVDRAKTLADRRGARPLEGDAVAPDQVERLFGQRFAVLLRGGEAGGGLHPVDLHAGGRDDAARGLGHLRSDPVAFDQHDLHQSPRVSGTRSECQREGESGKQHRDPSRRNLGFMRKAKTSPGLSDWFRTDFRELLLLESALME